MADISKLKKVRGLGEPPPQEEARIDLSPEPAEPPQAPRVARPVVPTPDLSFRRIDARTLRRSGRTVHFATKVTPEYDNRVRQLAEERGKLLTQILEESLAAYEREIANG